MFAGGCHADPDSASTSSPVEAVNAAPAAHPRSVRRTLDVVTTQHLRPEDLPELHFDPKGRWAGQGCAARSKYVELWQLGEGAYLGCFAAVQAKGACPYFAEISECDRWPTAREVSPGDEWSTTDPASSRRASLGPNSTTLEILDPDTNTPIEKIPLPISPDRGDVFGGFAVWGSERVIVILERGLSRSCRPLRAIDCEDEEGPSYEIWSWSEVEGVKFVATLNWETADYGVEHERVLAWYLGPNREWLFVALDNGAWAGEVAEFGLGSTTSGLGSRWATQTEELDSDGELRGRWLPGDPATWMTTVVGFWGETGYYHADWRAIHPGPEFVVQSGSLVEAADPPTVLDWNPVGFEDGQLVHDWTLCWEGDEASREGLAPAARALSPGCTGERPAGACSLLAVAPGGEELLAQCESGGWVGPPSGEFRSDARSFPGRVADFMWTQRGLIIATQGGLHRRSAEGVEPVDAPAGSRIVHARLSQAAGLVVVEGGGELFVLDPASGDRVLEMGRFHPRDAAFDPRGERLAIATQDEVLIYTVGESTPTLRWHAEGVAGLAWTQDGEAMMTGDSLLAPKRLWSLGRAPAELPVSFERLGPDHGWSFDPSWRWAANTDGGFIRTLDLVKLRWHGRAVYTDTGWFDGPTEDLDDLRVVFTDRPQWGVYEFSELEQLTRRRGLAGAFFAGRELGSPPTPEQPIPRRARGSN